MIEDLTSFIASVPDWAWVASNLILAGIAFWVRQHYLAKLERLKAELKREHDVELERLRRDHELEIDRKKKQYDAKRQQFERYWLMLDEYSKKQREGAFLTDTWHIFNECVVEFLEAVGDPSRMTAAFKKMMDALQNALQTNTQEYMQIRQETQSLRLVAGERLYEMLTELDKRLEEDFEMSSAFINQLTNFQAQLTDPSLLQRAEQQQEVVKQRGEELSKLYLDIMQEMRRELNET